MDIDTDQPDSSEREQRLDEVVAEYLNAVAAGLAPNRDAILARHPDLADELDSFFADHDQFDHWAQPLCQDAADDMALLPCLVSLALASGPKVNGDMRSCA